LTTPIPAVGGGSSHPLAKNGVAGPPHFVQGGGWSHSRFSSFSVFVFVFDFHLFFFFFFFLSKNNNNGQNDVILGWVSVVVFELVMGKIGILCIEWVK
jgi:hypothetical protein